MKKVLYIFSLFLLIFASCDPMKEINDELDKQNKEYSDNLEHTLSADDYAIVAELALEADPNDTINAEFIEDNMFFTEEISPRKYLPAFISDQYPALLTSSAALMTYDYYFDYPEYLSDLNEPNTYEVMDVDYATVGEDQGKYECFIGTDNPDQYIPGFLDNVIGNPTEGDIWLVLYKYALAVLDPSVTYKMEGVDMQMIVDHVNNDIDPAYVSSYGDSEYYYGASAYYQNFDARFSKRTEYNVPGFDGLTQEQADSLIAVRIQEAIVYWLGQKYPNAVPEVNGDIVYYNISYDTYDGAGHTYYVVYKCTAAGAVPTFELVDGPSETEINYSSTVKDDMGDYYSYDEGAWQKMEDVVYLSSADYAAMGAPGRYNNFSSSTPPDDYLPQYMSDVFPYGQAGDIKAVAYRYYDGSTIVKAEEYQFDGSWMPYKPVQEFTEQYLHVGTGWVFDPSLSFKLESADFQTIVDWVKSNVDASYVNQYGTGENYHCSDAYYGNFDLRAGHFETAEFATWEEAVEAAIGKAYLPTMYPDAQSQVGGADMYFIVNFDTYSGADGNYTMKFQVTKSAPDPEFTLVEGPY